MPKKSYLDFKVRQFQHLIDRQILIPYAIMNAGLMAAAMILTIYDHLHYSDLIWAIPIQVVIAVYLVINAVHNTATTTFAFLVEMDNETSEASKNA